MLSILCSVMITVLMVLTNAAYAQLIKNIGIKTGVSISKLEREYRWMTGSPFFKLASDRAVGYHGYITGDIVNKKYTIRKGSSLTRTTGFMGCVLLCTSKPGQDCG